MKTTKGFLFNIQKKGALFLGVASMVSGCTAQIPGSFRLAQQEEAFDTKLDINTKIDLLWVVDNSSSMDVSQRKLRDGFTAFANKYMKPTWDIRVAVITTDTYLAHSNFNTYLNTKLPGSTGYTSSWINSRLGTFTNPSYNTSLVNLSTGAFDNGIKYNEMVPAWGPNYSRLLAGYHDGPISALCFEGLPYFLNGNSYCRTRDAASANTGTSNCLSPVGAETSITQCVNTVQNDTVRSGKPIIDTMPPSGTEANGAWTSGLLNNFMVNVSAGSNGHGSERGLGSVLQLIADNENTATAFFRQSSLRGIIFVTDEEDQTMTTESSPAAEYNPWSFYKCDQSGLVALNPTKNISGNNGNCCSNGTCRFGTEGLSCTAKTVDGHTYTPSYCPVATKLKSVASVKSELDSFFMNLDSSTSNPNYFTVAITPLTAASIQALQASRETEDANVGAIKTVAVDRGDRYLELGTLVGNGSTSMDIGQSNYTSILDEIGRTIILKKGTFTLNREPTGQEDMLVWVLHANGVKEEISSTLYTVSGKTLTITDLDTVLSFSSTDKIVINYQPRSRG